MKKNSRYIVALLFSCALSLSGCASGTDTATQKQVKCGHLEICHDGHHHHNSRHHHGGLQDGSSEQNGAEQASD